MEIIVTPKKEAVRIDLTTGKIIKLKVAGYARVSTDLEDQKNSFEFQKKEFEERIMQNPDWDFVGMFSDEGISGTTIEKREGFKEMIEKAKAGEIDLILTKSISRFARNTVDCLTTIRELSAIGVSVYFEKENITTNKDNVDLVLTLYASLAESESRSISENVKWGVRKRMSKNERKVPVRTLVGYSQAENGAWYVNEDAILIKHIFQYFLNGWTYRDIAKQIAAEDKKGRKWNTNKVHFTLTCEKYKGFIIHQKTVTIDVLTHKRVKNDGIEPMYTIRGHHEAIIDEETFEKVQIIIKERNGGLRCRENTNYKQYAGLIYCEECGRTLRRIKYPYNNKYYLTCKNRLKNSDEFVCCSSSVIPYDAFESLAKEAYQLIKDDESVASSFTFSLIEDLSKRDFMKEINDVDKEIDSIEKEISALVKKQITDPDDNFSTLFASLKSKRSLKAAEKEEIQKLIQSCHDLQTKLYQIRKILDSDSFEYATFKNIIYKIIHRRDGSLIFAFKGEGFSNLSEAQIKKQIYEAPPLTSKIVIFEDTAYKLDLVILKGEQND